MKTSSTMHQDIVHTDYIKCTVFVYNVYMVLVVHYRIVEFPIRFHHRQSIRFFRTMDDFYITLPSSVKSDQFDNTSSRWVTRLPQVLYLEKEKYLVAATDVIYPYSFVNVSKELNYWVHFNDREPVHVTFPTAQYSNIDDVLNVLNGKPRATRKRKRDTQAILDDHMTVLKEGAKSAKKEAELKANFLKDSVTIGREAAAAAKVAKEASQAAITANVNIQKEAAQAATTPAPPVTPAPPPTTPAPPPPPSSTPAPPPPPPSSTPAPPPPPSSTSAPLTPGQYLTAHKQVLDGQITPFVNVVEGRTQRMEDIAKLHGDIAKSQAEAVQLGKDYEAACQAVLDGSENAIKDLEKVRAKMNIKVIFLEMSVPSIYIVILSTQSSWEIRRTNY
ncbi:unnamed protein product [Caenorhabditis nigoni]